MELRKDSYSVGVVIARMQVPNPTEAHKELILTVLKDHPKVLIFLGLSPVKGTINNPLDFQPRKQMLLEAFPHEKYPNITIGYIKDNPSDKVWSDNLDGNITDLLSPNDTVVLYGGRDSFIPHYQGRFPVRELVSSRHVSGSEIRAIVARAPQSNPDFRMGAIWATFQRYPAVFPTVDIAIVDSKDNRVLLARKPTESLYRFIGGFTSPTDDSYEEAAIREAYEESRVPIRRDAIHYIGSKKIDDWRYRSEADKIITHMFVGFSIINSAEANDDVAEVRWFSLKENLESFIVEQHRSLYKMLVEFLAQRNKK